MSELTTQIFFVLKRTEINFALEFFALHALIDYFIYSGVSKCLGIIDVSLTLNDFVIYQKSMGVTIKL